MKSNYDVVIVGGGPAGSMAAWEVAKSGHSVCLLEKDRDIGYPVRCGEAASDLGLRQFVEPKKSWIAETISGAVIVSPNESRVNVKFANETGYILNRRIFDYDLSRYASNAGAEVYTKAYVKDLIIADGMVSGVVLDYLGEEKKILSKIVIGADGLTSRIGRWAGLKTQIRMKDMESCVQYSVSNVDIDSNNMIMYVGENFAPGGYLWVFPKGDRFANIGIGISGKHSKHKSAKEYLDEFMKREFPSAAILTTMCGGVPCSKPIRRPIKNGLMLVGDAAHQVNPMTGGAGPKFLFIDTGSTATVNSIKTGAQAQMRATVETGRITQFVMTETGSGYDASNPPTVTIHCTQKTAEANKQIRIRDRVLGQPAFKNRGAMYTKFNAVTITGNGFTDKYQTGGEVIVDNLTLLPSPGDNLRFPSITDIIYKIGTATTISGSAPNIRAKLSIAPTMGIQESPEHGENVTIRQNYSQVRLTGHDFLDVGTGNTTTTNYPQLYTQGYGSINPPEQPWETQEYNGGRVFYASTDQDGNFRVGELFKVEQSTGIVTINASQFDLSGLDELRLGAFILGGTNAVIREFSKEQTFVANSNSIVPTQKAVAAYIQSRISGGGANVAANALTAGTCKFSQINHLSNTGDLPINIPVAVHGTKMPGGTMVAQAFNNVGIDTMAMMEFADDFEGDGNYYNGSGNGHGGTP